MPHIAYIIAVIAVIIILVIGLYLVPRRISALRAKAVENRLKSCTNDASAHTAVAQLTEVIAQDPTPVDYFMRADIELYNINNGIPTTNALRDFTDGLNLINQDNNNTQINELPFWIHRIQHINDQNTDLTDDIVNQIFELDHALLPFMAADMYTQHAREIRAQQIDPSLAPLSRADKFLETTFTNDPQNVHDSKVNSDLKKTLRKITKQVDWQAEVESATEYIKATTSGQKLTNAMQIMALVRESNYISTFNDTEGNIFAYVWARRNHPLNAANRTEISDMIVCAVADCIEHGHPVCINGRCGRYLSSLATLDFDETTGTALTFEAYKNQIYEEVKIIIEDSCTIACASDDPNIVACGQYMRGEITDIDPTDLDKFKAMIKQKINKLIDTYSDKLTQNEINNLTADCYASLE